MYAELFSVLRSGMILGKGVSILMPVFSSNLTGKKRKEGGLENEIETPKEKVNYTESFKNYFRQIKRSINFQKFIMGKKH